MPEGCNVGRLFEAVPAQGHKDPPFEAPCTLATTTGAIRLLRTQAHLGCSAQPAASQPKGSCIICRGRAKCTGPLRRAFSVEGGRAPPTRSGKLGSSRRADSSSLRNGVYTGPTLVCKPPCGSVGTVQTDLASRNSATVARNHSHTQLSPSHTPTRRCTRQAAVTHVKKYPRSTGHARKKASQWNAFFPNVTHAKR
jgi:hypothetical protein